MKGMLNALHGLQFKHAIEPGYNWFIYLVSLAALLTLAAVLAKKCRAGLLAQSSCLIVDKQQLGTKTTIYVLEYQNQRFLLADNQQALTLQALTREN